MSKPCDVAVSTELDAAFSQVPRLLHGYTTKEDSGEPHRCVAERHGETGSSLAPLLSRSEKLCVRHQRMADEGAQARLQKSIDNLSLAEQTAVNTVWSLFSSSPHSRRALILRGILTMCCFSQLSLLSSELAMAIRIDPFSLFPREVSLRVLGYLDAFSLGRAAQVSRLWRSLADNDLLWRNMCEQHIERKCEKCGWGLPLLTERRTRAGPGVVDAPMDSLAQDDEYREAAAASGDGSLRRTVTAAANAAAIERRSRGKQHSSNEPSRAASPCADEAPPAEKRARTDDDAHDAADACGRAAARSVTRPWKEVYCERLVIERNWRRGRHTVHVLTGHTDGIMCLAFRENASRLPYPVLVTGSYDRTVRVWNLATGEELRVLTGHARGVRCLQMDECKLITGSMDRTLKIWNWRTGELLRTLEGHTEGIVSLHFHGHILASGSADSNIRVWNFHTGECFSLHGHRDWVNAVHLWSVPVAPGRTEPRFLFSASDDGTIRLWDLELRECILVYRGHVGQVQSLKLVMMDHASVQRLGRGSAEFARGDWDDHSMTPRGMPGTPTKSCSDPSALLSVPPGSSAPSGAPGGAEHAAGASTLPDRFYDQGAYAAPRGDAAAATTSRLRRIPATLLRAQELMCAANVVRDLPVRATMDDIEDGIFDDDDEAAAPSGESQRSAQPSKAKRPVLISGSLDNTLKLWDVRTGSCIRTLFGHIEGVWGVDTDTLRIVSASHDRTIKIWDRDTGQCQNTLVGHRSAVTCVALGDDKIVSGSDDGDIRVWGFGATSAAWGGQAGGRADGVDGAGDAGGLDLSVSPRTAAHLPALHHSPPARRA
ncbi:hypothetical protein MSPP1_000636 [Malassezia sp. CBS 17886]|nr:hypothetical protein MSPP1_000636 [Malassezia sp. CBS 17886]